MNNDYIWDVLKFYLSQELHLKFLWKIYFLKLMMNLGTLNLYIIKFALLN